MRSTPHFTHQFLGHTLVEVRDNTEYHCEACKTDGGGTRFQCDSCSYCMHDYCTMCPSSISSFMHPHHPLTLAITHNRRICHICNDNIDGLFFFCQYCDNFNVHPLCTLLPQSLCHVLHQPHLLTLQPSGPGGSCMICRGDCPPWRYSCKVCNFDMHIECVTVPCGPGPSNDPHVNSPLTTERRIPPYAGYYPTAQNAYNNCYAPTPSYGGNGYHQYNNHYHHWPPQPHGDYGNVPGFIRPQNEMYYYNNYGNNLQQGEGSSGTTSNYGRYRKKMYAIIGQIATGVVSSIIFGLISA